MPPNATANPLSSVSGGSNCVIRSSLSAELLTVVLSYCHLLLALVGAKIHGLRHPCDQSLTGTSCCSDLLVCSLRRYDKLLQLAPKWCKLTFLPLEGTRTQRPCNQTVLPSNIRSKQDTLSTSQDAIPHSLPCSLRALHAGNHGLANGRWVGLRRARGPSS